MSGDQSAFEHLVISRLEQLQKGHEEIKGEIVAVGATAQRTLEQATRTNGRVASLEDWQASHIDFHLDTMREEETAAAFAEGRQSVVDDQRRFLARAWVKVEKPVIVALIALLAGVGAQLGAWFLGKEWGAPW